MSTRCPPDKWSQVKLRCECKMAARKRNEEWMSREYCEVNQDIPLGKEIKSKVIFILPDILVQVRSDKPNLNANSEV